MYDIASKQHNNSAITVNNKPSQFPRTTMIPFQIAMPNTHVAEAGVIPLRIAPEKKLVFSESLTYTSLEIGLKTIFHLWP